MLSSSQEWRRISTCRCLKRCVHISVRSGEEVIGPWSCFTRNLLTGGFIVGCFARQVDFMELFRVQWTQGLGWQEAETTWNRRYYDNDNSPSLSPVGTMGLEEVTLKNPQHRPAVRHLMHNSYLRILLRSLINDSSLETPASRRFELMVG